jgi:hypothetical protein
MGEPLMGKSPFGAITDLNKEITDFFKLRSKILYRKIQNLRKWLFRMGFLRSLRTDPYVKGVFHARNATRSLENDSGQQY